jgi:FixJ family two-component response regulator
VNTCALAAQVFSFELKVNGLSKIPVIAVVDDDTAVRAGIDSLIRSLGFMVCLFASAEEFLDSDCLGKADCLITDVQMPQMSGLQLHEHLTAQGMQIPTIFITAFPEESIRRRAMTGSAVGFLAKPFVAQLLIDCIESTFI